MSDLQPVPQQQLAAPADDLQGLVRMANTLAKSELIPKHFRGKPQNVLIAVDYARYMGLPYLSVMRATYIVHGSLGFKSEFMIARANASGIFDKPLAFEVENGNEPKSPLFKVRCFGFIDGTRIEGPWITWEMVRSEGWNSNPKYESMPEMMFRYRAATFFVRQACPQVVEGVQTVEELQDMVAAGEIEPRDVELETADALNAQITGEAATTPDLSPEEMDRMDAEIVSQEEAEAAAAMAEERFTLGDANGGVA